MTSYAYRLDQHLCVVYSVHVRRTGHNIATLHVSLTWSGFCLRRNTNSNFILKMCVLCLVQNKIHCAIDMVVTTMGLWPNKLSTGLPFPVKWCTSNGVVCVCVCNVPFDFDLCWMAAMRHSFDEKHKVRTNGNGRAFALSDISLKFMHESDCIGQTRDSPRIRWN